MVPQRLRLLTLALLHLHVVSSVPTNSTYAVPTNSTYTVPSLQNSTVTSTGTSTGLGDYIIAGLEHATSTSAGSQTENDRSDVASTSRTLSASSTSTNDGLTESKSPGNHTPGVLTGSMKISASPSPSASTSLTLSASGTSTNDRLIKSKFSGNHTSGVLTGSVRSTASPSPSGDQNVTADAYACNSARASWSSYSSNPRNLSTTSYTYTTTSYNASVGTADIYTTSDGIPVARGNLTSTGQTWYTTSISKEVYPTDKVEITGSSPTCTVPAHICTSWYESYMDALGLTLFEDVIPTRTAVPASILTMSPHCPQPMVRLDEHGNGVSTVGVSCNLSLYDV